ncbi:MAG: uroporphyrinogen decarboxylase [Clostridia bacterium]|nr:uroporphyrinogen decarboxylase [Clostridia bacterium]MBP3667100.1 uroporphyrinogen decarboxylase [Clostridia bacterium]
MTRRETVICALQHKETGRIPYHFELTAQEEEKVLQNSDKELFYNQYGGYLHYFQYWGYPNEQKDRKGYFTDDFGVTWNRNGVDKDIGVVDEPVIDEPDISLYPIPYLNEARIREECEKLLATKGDKFCFAGIGFSVFERLWSYLGMENALVYMITEPEFVHALLDKILEFNLKVIDIFNEYPFDGIYFGDDWGQQKGMIMGAPLWREFIKPRMEAMYRRAKQNGKFVLQHSCGDIQEVFEDLIEIGLDCYQTVQPEIYNLREIKTKYGDRLSFWGTISTQQALPCLSPAEIESIVLDTAAIMKQGGGFILAPTHAIPQDVPTENMMAMLRCFQKLG